MDRRRWVLVITLGAAVGVAAVLALTWDRDDDGGTGALPPSTTDRPTSSTASATSTSTTAAPTTITTSGGPGAAPGAVQVISAGSGGGSGEVVVDWDAVAGATGYRVLRAGATSGPFRIVADMDVLTGSTEAAAEVVNLWSEEHTYVPSGGALDAPDRSPWFQYVEVTGSDRRCFRVIAYNAAGEGEPSVVACGSPP
jgi:hypothetical protein